ncbi:MAG: hypothetical protein K5871_08935 [Lachnospiraceae bacterium]|nr:hypothetical protein [Lachnospiraceae bacterium]
MNEELIRLGIGIGATFALTLVHSIVKSKKENRHKMAAMPFIALAYGLVTIVFLFREFDSNVFEDNIALNFLSDDRNILLNVHFYAGYIAARAVLFGILCIFLKKTVFPVGIIKYFYAYNDRYGKWFLKDSAISFREFFKKMKYASALLCGLLLGLSWEFVSIDHSLTSLIFPFIPHIVIVEFYLFLGGYTEEEYLKAIDGDDSYSRKIRNFYKMRGIYDTLFPHEILVSGTGCEDNSTRNVLDLLEEMKDSEVPHEQKVSEFFRAVGGAENYNSDDILATMKLLNGKNVVFYDPFYRDLGKYIILPLLNTLLSGQYCLFVVGRNSSKADLISWISEMLDEYGKIESFWRVKELSFHDPECEIGVIGFNSLYDNNVMTANESFLENVGFVFLLEASLIINTGQVGLSILASQMERSGRRPVYCIADRITDGLVDTISHIIQDEITEVAAPPISRNLHTFIGWKAEGDYLRQRLFEKQTKYLGNGLELAAVAIKNQIPKVTWFGEAKAPLRDIKWIAGQYYASICRYMNIPVQQESMYEKIEFVPDLWSAEEKDEHFVIAEDEFTNLFATIRTFLSRGKTQTFVNVLSENYLLRDYMRCNTVMFLTNPDAIPCMVPDYAKSERNTLIKLLFMMQNREVSASEVVREFTLAGTESDDAMYLLSTLLKKYLSTDISILNKPRIDRSDFTIDSVTGETYFSINPARFQDEFGKTLQTAYFVCEDESGKEYLDARLFGNVTQTLMPGYLLTFAGKYYRVENVTANNGVVLHRASNLYDGRRYYRQIRKYKFAPYTDEDIRELRTVMDVEIARIEMDFEVNTPGYLEMNSLGDLRSARVHDLSGDPRIDDFSRKYYKKNVLRIKLPDTDDRVRYTICMLLSESFRSIFPDAWQYIAALTVMPDDVDGVLNYMVYDIEGSISDEYIYIVEDSELDLGLIEAVEKNLKKFLELITDFLVWHFEKMREPERVDPKVVTSEFPEVDHKKKKARRQFLKRIKTLFGLDKFEEENKKNLSEKAEEMAASAEAASEEQTASDETADVQNESGSRKDEAFSFDVADTVKVSADGSTAVIDMNQDELIHDDPVSEGDDASVKTDADGNASGSDNTVKGNTEGYPSDEMFEPDKTEDPDIVAIDGTDIFDETGSDLDKEYFEECFDEIGIGSRKKTRYQDECFLKFGFDKIDDRLKLDEVKKYLTLRGFGQNEFRKARTRDSLDDTIIDLKAETFCDFCGMPLTGVSFEQLTDGRIRCNDCSSTAINSLEEFTKIYYQCETLMEGFFDIHFDTDIEVKLADARKIARGWGSVYRPTTDADARVLGFARKMFGKYSIFIENGSPRLETINTLVHEMTHIWQYLNWNEKEIKKLYRDPDVRTMIYEGMAVWVSIQYLYMIGEYSYARKKELLMMSQDDVYGLGFKLYLQRYPMVRDSSMLSYSPFKYFPPLDGE